VVEKLCNVLLYTVLEFAKVVKILETSTNFAILVLITLFEIDAQCTCSLSKQSYVISSF